MGLKTPTTENVFKVSKSVLGIIPKTVSALNVVVNTVCSVGIALGIAHKATEGESTQRALDVAEAVVGENGMRQLGQSTFDGARYLGQGVVGVGQTINDRYGKSDNVIPAPPISRIGVIAESVGVAAYADVLERGGIKATVEPRSVFEEIRHVAPAESAASAPQVSLTSAGVSTPTKKL